MMLKELDLDYVVDDEVLLITTPEEASSEDRMMTKVYPVGDLVLPIQSGAGANPFSLGGGMGGQGGMPPGMGGIQGMENLPPDVRKKLMESIQKNGMPGSR